MKKFIKYLTLIIFAIVIAKWIVMLLPTSQNQPVTTQNKYITTPKEEIKEITLNLNFKDLQPQIQEEYIKVRKDIYNYIQEQISHQKEEAKYRLSQKEDNFLDWLFGYFTGWKMMWKKAKGLMGSDDNEVKLVSDKFEKDVINPGLKEMFDNIDNYTKMRIEDYYKSVMMITINYINQNIQKLKDEGYTDIQIDKNSIPWGNYVTQRGGDLFTLTEASGVTGIGVVVGKFVGSKVAAIIGPKLLGIVEAKTATIIAGKIASAFEFLLAPIIDIVANEAVKQAKWDETKKTFEGVIDEIFTQIEDEIKYNVDISLVKIKNEIYKELNKQVIIKAKGIK
jgi:hypothetical protein